MAVTPAFEIEAEILEKLHEDEEIRSWPRRVADAAADYARSIAPVYAGKEYGTQPGHFRDSITAVDAPDVGGMPAAQVRSDLREASFIEYGAHPHGGTTPEHATFAKTVAHFEGTPGVEMLMGEEVHAEAFTESPFGADLSNYPILE
jgi:hypothetical protein